MKELSLQMLRDSGLTLDWQTVCVGWRGFPSHLYYWVDLPIEEVRNFVYDSLEYAVDAEYQQAMVSLIDAEPGGGLQDAMGRYSDVLIARSGVTKELATRKWRYAAIWQGTNEICSVKNRYEKDGIYSSHPLYAGVSGWNEIISTNLIPEIEPVYPSEELFLLMVQGLRSWLAQEKQYLTQMGQMAQPSASLA